MPQGQSEGTSLRQQPRLWDSYPVKNPNLRHHQASSQNKGLSRASRLRTSPSPAQDMQARAARGRRGNPDPREASSTKLQAGFIANQDFLGFWMVDIRQQGRSQKQLPRRDTRHTWEGETVVHPENQVAGMGEVISRSLQLGATVLAKHLVTWAARTWDGHKTQAQASPRVCGEPKNLNSLDLGNACNPGPASDSSQKSNLEPEQCRPGKYTRSEQGRTQCGWNTASAPHTCQWCLFAVFLPPHSTTEHASLKKSAPLPTLCQGGN